MRGVTYWTEGASDRRIVVHANGRIWALNADWSYDPDFETNVEVTFAEDGDHVIVTFENRDLERFGDRAGETRTSMDMGWGQLLAGFEQATEA